MHFLRALHGDSLRQENFEICNVEIDSCGNRMLTHSMKAEELRLACTPDSMTLYHFTPTVIYYSANHPELYKLPYVFRYRIYNSRIDFSDTLQVYKDGYYPDAYNISWSGAMGEDLMAEMLPYDYVPKPLEQVSVGKEQ
jgi:hypothetical protein